MGGCGDCLFWHDAGLTTVASADGDVVPAVKTEQVEVEAVTSISQTPVASVATISQDEYTNVVASSSALTITSESSSLVGTSNVASASTSTSSSIVSSSVVPDASSSVTAYVSVESSAASDVQVPSDAVKVTDEVKPDGTKDKAYALAEVAASTSADAQQPASDQVIVAQSAPAIQRGVKDVRSRKVGQNDDERCAL